MTTFGEEVLAALRSSPGMTDRELMDHLRGPSKHPSQANQECRLLESRGCLTRVRREGGTTRNYLVGTEPEERLLKTQPVNRDDRPARKADEVPRTDPQSVFLVSCVSRKRPEPAPAKELYRSDLFQKARHFVEARGCRWFVLSAKHGLVHPDAVIEPYEQTLNKMSATERRKWAGLVISQIDQHIGDVEHVVFLAGKRYREDLVKELQARGVRVDVPMAGLGIGEQLSWLGRNA